MEQVGSARQQKLEGLAGLCAGIAPGIFASILSLVLAVCMMPATRLRKTPADSRATEASRCLQQLLPLNLK